MRPQTDDYPEHIERAIQALLTKGIAAGAQALSPISYPPREISSRRAMNRATFARIFLRDHFTCRYCDGRTILTGVMELLGAFYPDSFPFLSVNWRAGVTHPAVISRSPAVDHVVPVAAGGDSCDDNLVTACTPCNSIKADFSLEQLGWRLQPIRDTDWDGLIRFYPRLWNDAGRPKPSYHLSWLQALALDPAVEQPQDHMH